MWINNTCYKLCVAQIGYQKNIKAVLCFLSMIMVLIHTLFKSTSGKLHDAFGELGGHNGFCVPF